MAVTVKGNIYDGAQGARIEMGTFTLNPASIGADSQVVSSVTLSGAEVGDLIFINPRACTAGLAVQGVYVSATDTLSVAIQNTTEAAVDGAELTYDYILVKF